MTPSSTRGRWFLLVLTLGCGAAEPEPRTPAGPARSAPITFAYGTPGGAVISSATTRGRVTALLFVTTFDLPSQVLARHLDDVISRHTPRANAVAIVVEPPMSAPLVEVFKTTLGLRYEVALTGSGEERNGPFGDIDRVPTLIVLDRQGREVSRTYGALEPKGIVPLLKAAEE